MKHNAAFTARELVKEAVCEYIKIGASDFEGAVLNILDDIDIADKVTDAIASKLPKALELLVEEIVDEQIEAAVEGLLEDFWG